MKPRTVLVTLQVETTLPLSKLRSRGYGAPVLFPVDSEHCWRVRQVQVNVAQQPTAKKPRRRR